MRSFKNCVIDFLPLFWFAHSCRSLSILKLNAVVGSGRRGRPAPGLFLRFGLITASRWLSCFWRSCKASKKAPTTFFLLVLCFIVSLIKGLTSECKSMLFPASLQTTLKFTAYSNFSIDCGFILIFKYSLSQRIFIF